MNIFRNQVRWLLIAWMFVISAVAYLDRVNISIAGSLIEREFGFDHVHLGWAALGFFLRLPVVRPLMQLLVDASGGESRPIPALKQHAE